jgi:hypothetical protein
MGYIQISGSALAHWPLQLEGCASKTKQLLGCLGLSHVGVYKIAQ